MKRPVALFLLLAGCQTQQPTPQVDTSELTERMSAAIDRAAQAEAALSVDTNGQVYVAQCGSSITSFLIQGAFPIGI